MPSKNENHIRLQAPPSQHTTFAIH